MPLIVFILILSVLILVHEWGHFITARRCGVKVDQFALGFGPKLWSTVKNGTEFCLCAIPLGGFVKMAGDERDKILGRDDEYFSKSPGLRALIIVMGPVVNLLLAYMCFWFVFMIGYVDLDSSTEKVAPIVGQILGHSAAQKAGLQVGDKIISINHKPVVHWFELQDDITGSSGSLAVMVERKGHDLPMTITPEETKTQDIFGRHHLTRRIGIGPMPITNTDGVTVTRYGFLESFAKAGQELAKITLKTYQALYEMAIGERSPKEAMGIVGMFFVIKFALTIGFSFLLHIVGIISASLAIFNLLPVIPLDGGHLFLLGLEKIRGRPLSLQTDQMISKAGFTLIIVLALFVFYSDFERIGLIDKIREVIHV